MARHSEAVQAGEDEGAGRVARGFDDLAHYLDSRNVGRGRVAREHAARRDRDVCGVERRRTDAQQGVPGAVQRGRQLGQSSRLTDHLDNQPLHLAHLRRRFARDGTSAIETLLNRTACARS